LLYAVGDQPVIELGMPHSFSIAMTKKLHQA
jgi:hypothetical protein